MMTTPDADAATDGLVDVQHLKHLLGFVTRSVWRHRLLVAGLFTIVLGLTIGAFAAAPRQYLVQTRLFAQRNFVMPSINNPRRTVPMEADAPTRMASETVMKRENLVSIIKQANLVDEWFATRAPAQRFKDYLVNLIAGDMSESEQIEALVGTMERRMWVLTDDATVTIGVLWNDPNSAYRIIHTAQQNFINERHNSEISTIQESINILERQSATVHNTISEAYSELRRDVPTEALVANTRRNATAEAKIGTLQAALATKRLAIADLEGFQRRRLAELQTRLAEQRNTYGPNHPALATTQQSIEEVSREAPQLTELRGEERQIATELRALGVDPNAPTGAASLDQNLARAALASIVRARDDSLRAERVSYLRTRLQMAEHEYEDLLQRLQGARIELETARAAFKYRYGMITPPQVPKRPVRPRAIMFLAGGVILAGMLALVAGVAVDVGSGRVLESWQVERLLGVKVLREVTSQ
jgi:uncharacterized protein involved in exopolysaccharide biosynthesis